MSLFKEIVNESLLKEAIDSKEDRIIAAINGVKRARIVYNDKKGGKGKNERFILPVAYGLTKSGKKAVRAFETMGSSKRGLTNPPNNRKFPKWKMFLLDNIVSWSNGKQSFRNYKDMLVSMGLNLHGDKSMTELYAITPMASDDVQVAKTTNPIGPKPITKLDVEPSSKSQEKSTTDQEKFVPAAKTRQNAVDKTTDTGYTTNTLNAPETEPVTKQEVGGTQENPTTGTSVDIMASKTSPITKDEIENGGENKDDVMDKFTDLTNRMNNLYNDEEDEENGSK